MGPFDVSLPPTPNILWNPFQLYEKTVGGSFSRKCLPPPTPPSPWTLMGSGNPALRGLKRRDPGGKRGIRYTLLAGRKQFPPPLQLGSFTRSNIFKEYIENKQGIKHCIREQPINIFKTMKINYLKINYLEKFQSSKTAEIAETAVLLDLGAKL